MKDGLERPSYTRRAATLAEPPTRATGRSVKSQGVCQVWSFRGTRGAVRAIAARLLGVKCLSNLP